MRPISDSLASQTDEELACQVAAGAVECFEELVTRHGGGLLRFLRQRAASAEDAEDLAQQAFVKAYRKIRLFNPSYRFRTWLFTIARRLAISHARKRRPVVQEYEAEPVDVNDPSRLAAQREAQGNIWGLARTSLPEAHFTVLWLRYGEAMSVAEIAAATAASVANVKVRLHRARRSLVEHVRQSPLRADMTEGKY
ncbi:MAG: sigma-70 family RNA polymerase sigma factor [Victivallales bacterium]|jgi:RNA polymerase sigma-70 factor, ECF subfamily|nr:sigma-70 family RNA polymerase sigma factor [Victivallales bacterium]MBT7166868.1 sigma-70 family RNA polymerase sigma factor [Victivallales bacterium]MBT7300431.1 sigma-70 family RNA polymerase sigma factor [Victivallales bacterium]